MKIKINNPNLNKEFFINIPLKEKDLKSEIDSIVHYVISLNDKINNLEKQIKENKIELENKIKEEINLIKNEFILSKKNSLESEKKKMFENSNIIQSDEIDLILSWFEKKPISFNLLLDSNKDGDSMEQFFNKCGNKSPTMIFIKTTENLRFGGYTNEMWPKNGTKKDENSFIFSLNKKKKYKVINSKYAIGVSQNDWFYFWLWK